MAFLLHVVSTDEGFDICQYLSTITSWCNSLQHSYCAAKNANLGVHGSARIPNGCSAIHLKLVEWNTLSPQKAHQKN
ncbi:putative phosphoric monoester hydrolase [Dioscorea sansibarensis]